MENLFSQNIFEQQLLKTVGGVGLFIYSLRIITQSFDNLGSDKFRRWIERLTANSLFSVLLGTFFTLLFQASSTTILLAMGLLNRSLLTIEQAALIMLGAGLGTTFKTWMHWDVPLVLGAILILFSTLGILINWRNSRLRTLELSLGLGLTILGMHLMTSGLAPFLDSPTVLEWLSGCRGSTFIETLISIFVGFAGTVLVQSSSSVVLVAIALTTKGALSFEGASAIILGANLGTTSTALLLSIGQSIHAKRLAFLHFFSKSVGVLFSLFFFKSFLSLILTLTPPLHVVDESSYHLAMVHTGFNILNLVFWWTLMPILLKVGQTVLKDKAHTEYWLSSLGVQKLLEKLPERAIQEGRTELQEIVRGYNEVTNSCINLIGDESLESAVKEEIAADLPVQMDVFEKRLKSLESVMGRVAVRWGETPQLQPRIFELLEKIYRLSRISLALRELVRVADLVNFQEVLGRSEIDARDLRNALLGLGDLVRKQWDEFYRNIPEDSWTHSSARSAQEGAVLFELFLKDREFRTGIMIQRVYSALFSLYKELEPDFDSKLKMDREILFDVKRTFVFTVKENPNHPPT